MNQEKLLQLIALLNIKGIGNITAKSVISFCGGIENVFDTPKSKLLKIPGLGSELAGYLVSKQGFANAEKELKFIEENKITPIDYWSKAFPYRLKNLPDAPTLLYTKGNFDFNKAKVLAIVGTRKCTDYGKTVLKKIINQLSKFDDLLIVSGLAYGIDKTAHVEALNLGIENVAILGHGLQTIYPKSHYSLAKKICEKGGLVTEFTSQEVMNPANFPKRNRIIAGICDALLVVETDVKGGSMVSAELAFSYNREVFAIPGNVDNKSSAGCNKLIKLNKAILTENASDIMYNLSWDLDEPPVKQAKLFVELTDIEQKIYDSFSSSNELHIEKLIEATNMNLGTLSSCLLSLEIKGLIKTLPGSVFKKIG